MHRTLAVETKVVNLDHLGHLTQAARVAETASSTTQPQSQSEGDQVTTLLEYYSLLLSSTHTITDTDSSFSPTALPCVSWNSSLPVKVLTQRAVCPPWD